MKKSSKDNENLELYLRDVDADLHHMNRRINDGFKPIRVTTAQRNTLTKLFPGLIIYNVSTQKLNVYTTTWEEITSA